MTDPDAGYHQMRAQGATAQEVFRRAVADGRVDALRIIRRVFGLGYLDAKELSLEVTGSPSELAAWRDQFRRSTSQAAPRESEYGGKVEASMLRRPTTLDDYFCLRITSKSSSKRAEPHAFWEERRASVAGRLRRGDELWVWQEGEGFGSFGGLALVREGEVIHAWLHWFS
jgi:hypothetical protein